jgi:hypothetical protein
VVTNAPILGRHEPLRVDVIPGGAGGGQMTNDALSLLLGTTNAMEALRLTVSYELLRNGAPIAAGDFIRLPTPQDPQNMTLAELLSLAFLLKPKVKLVPGSGDPLDLDLELPTLDHELLVKLTVQGTATVGVKLERTIRVPFTVPTVEIPLPFPAAVCVCSAHANLDASSSGQKFLIMLPPGSPSSVPQIVQTYNQLLDTVNALQTVLSIVSPIIAPLQKVVDTLSAIPTPYVTTDAWVKDFDDYDDFDDEMSSFLLVGPTGWGVQFSDTANMGDWDDVGNYGLKSYKAIDLLKLPDSPEGQYVMGKLGIAGGDISTLKNKVAELSGVPVGSVELGIGVMYVHNLADGSVPSGLRHYDTLPGDTVQDDTESARWTF